MNPDSEGPATSPLHPRRQEKKERKEPSLDCVCVVPQNKILRHINTLRRRSRSSRRTIAIITIVVVEVVVVLLLLLFVCLFGGGGGGGGGGGY